MSGQNAQAPVDVLYELRRQGVTGTVYFAVAELIEADREFDAAHEAYAQTHVGTPYDEFVAVLERKRAAIVRRRAALARVGGEQS